jgi:hypothetical protein
METTAAPYKLCVRVGNAEFKACGPQEVVRDQFDLFMGVLSSIPGAVTKIDGKNGAKTVHEAPHESGLPPDYHEQFESSADGGVDPQANGSNGSSNNGHFAIITQDMLDRAYRIEGSALSLRVLPHGKDQHAAALLLLVYGYDRIFGQKEVGAVALTEAARQSGVMLARIDRTVGRMKMQIRRGGRAKGTRYQITNPGMAEAEKLLAGMFT